MPTYTFAKVERRASKTVKCIGCGKRLKRSTTLFQTLSPFNKNQAGEVKTHDEIQAELEVEAARWEQGPEWCAPCGDVLRVRASELQVGDVVVHDDNSRVPVVTAERVEDGYNGRIVVNAGGDALELTGATWVTRFPADLPAA